MDGDTLAVRGADLQHAVRSNRMGWGDEFLSHALGAAKHAAALKRRARHVGVLALYANG